MAVQVFTSVATFREWRESSEMREKMAQGLRLSFVPTMGALHRGHSALISQAKAESDLVVLSIFVNPTQFNQMEDFEKYPKTAKEDLAIAEAAGADIVLMPDDTKELYPDDYRFTMTESRESLILCGAHRPGHFNGVLSVVLKLFQIVSPSVAYFGEKDFQQLRLITEMSRAYFLPLKVKPVPTVREESGLALSSRNRRLSPEGLKKAAQLYETLRLSIPLTEAKARLVEAGFEVEYFEEHWGRRFVAAWLEGVRLIDNVPVEKILEGKKR
jgi:pantoate--beta-alanine ligase